MRGKWTGAALVAALVALGAAPGAQAAPKQAFLSATKGHSAKVPDAFGPKAYGDLTLVNNCLRMALGPISAATVKSGHSCSASMIPRAEKLSTSFPGSTN